MEEGGITKSRVMSIAVCLIMITSISGPITQNVGQPQNVGQLQNLVQSGPSPTSGGTGDLADSPWPMFRQNLNHTGQSPYDTSANPGTEKWNFTAGQSIASSPSIGFNGIIYVGSYDDKLYAINPDGSQRWNFSTGSDVISSPAIGFDGTIYVGSRDGKVYAINPDGTEKWNYATYEALETSPAIDIDGTIYIGSQGINLFAINPDGTKKWNLNMGDSMTSSPAIGADGTIYIGCDNYHFYAINPDGSVKWNIVIGDDMHSSPAISPDGTIYVGGGRNLYAIRADGSIKWNFVTGDWVYSSPAIGSDGTIYVGSHDHKLYAISPYGSQKWSFTTGHGVHSSPAIGSDRTVYVGSLDYKLYAINPDGTEKWNFTTGRNIHSSPAIGSDGTIYIGSWDGNLYAIGGLAPNIVVEKTANVTIAKPGNLIEYTIYYNNTGPDGAGTVWINDTLPEGVTFITSSAEGNRTGDYNWTFYNVPAKAPTWFGPYLPSVRPGPGITRNHAIAYDSTNNRVVLFGGSGDNGFSNETWEYNTATHTWDGPFMPNPCPSARIYHDMAYDSVNNKIVMYGGYVGGSDSEETWEYDTATHTWFGPYLPSNRPGPDITKYHAMTYDSANNRIVLFGGSGDSGFSNETWEYDSATHTWSGPYTPNPHPSARAYHDMAYDFVNNKIVMYGGYVGGSDSEETWEYDSATHTWSGPYLPSTRPGPEITRRHTMAYDSAYNRIVLFGGSGDSGFSNETWEYDSATQTWYGPFMPNPNPVGRVYHDMAYDSVNNKIVMYGGYIVVFVDSEETWEYTHSSHNYFTITVQINSDVANGTILTNYAHLDYTDSLGNLMEDSIDSADVLVLAPVNKPPTADAGPDQTVNEGSPVRFDASASYDPDGTVTTYEWDFDVSDGLWWETGAVPDAIGPTPTHTYGDDGVFIVTLRVIDNDNLSATDTCNVTVQNVDPTVTIESITMEVEIGLRVAGRKYNNVSMSLYENGSQLGYVSIERMPGSPDEQMAWIPVSINFSSSYNATVTYTPEDPPNVGGNPVWIYLKSKNGSIKKIHHTFNVQQSKKRDSEHWNHIEPWEVDLNGYFIGLPFEITSHITDPGSDDETLTFTYGSQVKIVTYLNNPPNPDPYPSPEVNPVDILDTTTLIYEGPGTIYLTVTDDDGGAGTQIIAVY